MLAGCALVSDGGDLGVRLGGRKLFNGPIRSRYDALPHRDADALSLRNHVSLKNKKKAEKHRHPSCFTSSIVVNLSSGLEEA